MGFVEFLMREDAVGYVRAVRDRDGEDARAGSDFDGGDCFFGLTGVRERDGNGVGHPSRYELLCILTAARSP